MSSLPVPDPKYELAHEAGETLEHLLGFVFCGLQQDVMEELDTLDLSLRQLGLLFMLRDARRLHVGALAEAGRLSLPATSHMIDRLVRRGLLERRENPEDRRQKHVLLTPAASEVLARIEGSTVEAFTRLLSGLPEDVLARFEAACRDVREHLPPSPRAQCAHRREA
ncbi:MarR family winged helix-turn-helix transcriptional regulator [Deinococcus pimensis]|uniref:MarR family winged helix-turn-helix transcriptional regulator n=1 Tax=Deinococcus pimensis TaxID=309888 RepID=UPI0004BB65E4|nr:MarR family transcriptional regulator [Deinococcus pimensis]